MRCTVLCARLQTRLDRLLHLPLLQLDRHLRRNLCRGVNLCHGDFLLLGIFLIAGGFHQLVLLKVEEGVGLAGAGRESAATRDVIADAICPTT